MSLMYICPYPFWLKLFIDFGHFCPANSGHTRLCPGKLLAAAMNKLAPVLALGPAGAENFVQGCTLSFSWKDCGDASTKGKVSSLAPTSLTLGTKTKVNGAGFVDWSHTSIQGMYSALVRQRPRESALSDGQKKQALCRAAAKEQRDAGQKKRLKRDRKNAKQNAKRWGD